MSVHIVVGVMLLLPVPPAMSTTTELGQAGVSVLKAGAGAQRQSHGKFLKKECIFPNRCSGPRLASCEPPGLCCEPQACGAGCMKHTGQKVS